MNRPTAPSLLRLSLLAVATLAGTAVSTTAVAAEKTESPVFIEVDQAGPDYAVQGEYLSDAKPALGVQVIAYGKGTFTAVILPGGLPGAGWDGKTRQELSGKTAGTETTFSGDAGKAVISAGALTFIGSDGKAVSLKKTVRVSPTLGAKPPAGAVVLFDGTNVDAWDDKAKIQTVGGEKVLAYGPETKAKFTSYQLHVEFRTPFKPQAKGQERGNSGVYIHHTYEFQVLDSFGLVPENNYTGSLYTLVPPSVNACFPPLTWQTYDIDFNNPQFDAAGMKTKNAHATVKLNGITVQDDLDIPHGTGANKTRAETPAGGPLWLQDHQNPVFFRNVWLMPKK
ncbi:MAG TPA: DUF1080 domain-containing protein [Planctomycetota bacterium]|nr:DUF1080 domain-containing protein [Planctomycetota bacterium]